jgi:hypothetical protein
MLYKWDIGNACRVLLRKHEGYSHLEAVGIEGRIILNWILNMEGVCELDSFDQHTDQ